MSDLITMLSASSGAAGAEESDPNFNQTVLLLHGDGTDGAQNNTFLDSSTNNFTITRNGNTTQGTFSPFSVAEGQWSNYFDGTGDYLSVAYNSALTMPSGTDFCIEAWIYRTINKTAGGAAAEIIAASFPSATSGNWLFRINNPNEKLEFYVEGSVSSFESTSTLDLNEWFHVAVTRDGTTFRLFVNGTLEATTTATANIGNASNAIMVGRTEGNTGTDWPGYISNYRMVVGSAVYTASFTPSTTPLTAITNTQLLTCQSNRFVDNSSNAFAITVNGNTSVQPFSPFAPSAAYSTSVNGGSGYFDGTGDRLVLNNVLAFGTNDFSVEAWVYPTSFATTRVLIDFRPSSTQGAYFQMNIQTTGKFRVFVNTAARIDADNAINLNEWTHVCVQNVSGVMTMYVNGVAQSTTWTHTTNFLTAANRPFIGASGFDLSSHFIGYMSGIRILINGAAYSPPFSTPTSPPTAITNTELLCNFTNAGIFDNTGKNNLETVGNAQIDTTVKKYGTGSMEFDGTGDWLLMPSSQNFAFGSGDFTVEMWIYITNGTPSFQGLFGGTGSGATDSFTFSLTGERLRYSTYSADILVSDVGDAISLNTWTHVALTRESGTARLFKDGVLIKSVAGDTTAWTASPFVVGNGFANSYPFYGLIDDLRITKGVARYTTTFSVPTKAFPDQ